MNFSYLWITFFVFFLSVTNIRGECQSKSTCQSSRDIITYSSEETDNETSSEVWWKLIPSNSNGNILLAFKGFLTNGTDGVKVHIRKTNQQVEIQSFKGQLGSFEIIATDVENVLINFNQTQKSQVNFTLHYYGECGFATANPVTHFGIEEGQKCVIFIPETYNDYTRVYITMRNVQLQPNLRLKVQDIHTSTMLADVENNEHYKVVSADSNAVDVGTNKLYFLIDLECSTNVCNYNDNFYLLSFYVMNQRDVSCIEFQRFCLFHSEDFPPYLCRATCPAMRALMEQEYYFETLPLLMNQANISTHTPSSTIQKIKKQYCPFPPKFCQCEKNFKRDRSFCLRKTFCLKLKNEGCAWRCILTKVFRCTRTKRLEVTLI